MAAPEIVIVAAVAAKNLVIGKENKLPWHISADLKRFKRLTTGHPVLMGRKTFESIIARNGRPLPERRNIVLSSNPGLYEHADVSIYPGLEAALSDLQDAGQISVIGGAAVYKATLPLAHRLELTLVEGDYAGDAYFPEFSHLVNSVFRLEQQESFDGYSFVTYRKY